jgi:hypothetical protein
LLGSEGHRAAINLSSTGLLRLATRQEKTPAKATHMSAPTTPEFFCKDIAATCRKS